MHVTILLHAGCDHKSSQRRILHYVPLLEQQGIHCDLLPFYGPPPRAFRHCGQTGGNSLASGISTRIKSLRQLTGQTDLLWIEQEALPHLPWMAENLLLPSDMPIVTDLGDTPFSNDSRHSKTGQIIRHSTLVMVGNSHIGTQAHEAGASWVEVMPPPVPLSDFTPTERSYADRKLRVGWIGTTDLWTSHAEKHFKSLEAFLGAHNAVARIIGARAGRSRCGQIDYHPRETDGEYRQISAMDIALAPLQDSQSEQGSCGYAVLRYMACGIPVIASPLGAQAEIIEHGVNGFLASTGEEWRKALSDLLENPALRQRIGTAGRTTVENLYTPDRLSPKMASLLTQAAGKKSRQEQEHRFENGPALLLK
ncbi:glycosyltransferase [Altericroceibacterium spongiae]|uniref:Glycosyltransferase n=1 Tax=Altericroceibacterium spongiae TaxID=2320269 RepID=A0A420EF32_9SPHN|nr:glycosyltransferase family 4 protein [Altericroceibacterium spongiae]RKF19307.1 glycosyltransferase [Altericroceibacterium spongiae]